MKRIILLYVFSLPLLQLAAQTKTVTIHGIVKDTSVKSIEITHPTDDKLSKWENKNLTVENGAFSTSIQIPFPVELSVTIGTKIYRKNFVYSDTKMLIDTAGKPHIIGSPIHDEYEKEFLSFFQSNEQVYDTLKSFYSRNYRKYGPDLPKYTQDSATLLKEKYYYQRAKLLGEYIKLHPESYVALWDIYLFASLSPLHQYFDFDKLFTSFSKHLQSQPFMSVLKEKIKESGRMQVGQLFPKDFFKGHEQLQSKIKKKNYYYLIDFWYSHCGPCIARFPRLKEIYNQFHIRGFDIVSISVDKKKDKKDYTTAIKKNNLAWNHVWDKDGVTSGKFNINGFPTYILLDKNDRIISYDIQDNELEAFLRKNLESSPKL